MVRRVELALLYPREKNREMIDILIEVLLYLFGRYDEESEYYGFYIGNLWFTKESYGEPLNKYIVSVSNIRKNKSVYTYTQPLKNPHK